MRRVTLMFLAIVMLAGLSGCGYNTMQANEEAVFAAWGDVEASYQRRADLVPNLVETVKGYAAHESEVLEEVTRARAGLAAAAASDDVAARAVADNALESALGRLTIVAEAYPDLKADQTFLELQRQLAQTEDQVAFSRTYYNDAVGTLNTLVVTIPWMFLTGIASVGKREFYDAPASHDAPPTVSF